MYGGYGGDGRGSQVSMGPSACISTIYIYKNAMQNYFCETMKYEKMNDDIFLYFYASTVNISYGVFMLRKNYLHGA